MSARGYRRLRGAGIVALMIALAMRLLVPTGYMWTQGANGAPRLILCSGVAPVSIATMPGMPGMDREEAASSGHDHPFDRHDGGGGDHACAFAGLAGALVAAADLAVMAPTIVPRASLPPSLLADARPGRGLAAPPPPKTGPPATL